MFRLEPTEDWKDAKFARAHPRLVGKLRELEARKLIGKATDRRAPAPGRP